MKAICLIHTGGFMDWPIIYWSWAAFIPAQNKKVLSVESSSTNERAICNEKYKDVCQQSNDAMKDRALVFTTFQAMEGFKQCKTDAEFILSCNFAHIEEIEFLYDSLSEDIHANYIREFIRHSKI